MDTLKQFIIEVREPHQNWSSIINEQWSLCWFGAVRGQILKSERSKLKVRSASRF